ncbi:MAG: ABC transporter permease subunit [Candidatus Eisenbacteria bacterium]|uniref:ABC transporter permease subunit n=1 Tax=Eiseniibacteriota bacterium TaxID=2212470 RepID=A0A948RVZ0_UNCEI|nr:ABC transporter permease subunit [Candidatus Eisenbacteria bacterium]MBU1948666.1 ABC transporter permease subunit [Candidatus Eisenbacteria bacterium]MBU2690976.1 ABC transporter permease subunit [Candidatus Eisenbacteria bacterium]
MSNVLAVFRKEFRSYFNSAIAYVFITIFLVLSIWLFFRSFFLINQASMRDFFGLIPLVFLLFVPAVTMRLWAEERKMGTMELLMTLPVTDFQVVFGKYLASLAFLSLTVILTFPLALMVEGLGNPDWGPIIGSYIGAMLLGGAYLAIGLFISSLTENQIVAFIISVVACFLLFIIGEDIVLYSIPVWLRSFCQALGLGAHFDSVGRGVIDSRDVIFYLSLIGFFLYLNVRSIEKRSWA